GETKDVPCTLTLQFFIRLGRLHTIVTMRSSDAFLGFPYDIYNFSMIGNTLAGELGVEVGTTTMQLGSFHLYERDWEAAKSIVAAGLNQSFCKSPKLSGFPPAQQILDGALSGKPFDLKSGWEGYRATLWEGYRMALATTKKEDALVILKGMQNGTE